MLTNHQRHEGPAPRPRGAEGAEDILPDVVSAGIIALYLPSLGGGGAERMMVSLANGLTERGRRVDLVLARREGPYLAEVSPEIRVIDLESNRTSTSIWRLTRYLRRERPKVLLSAMAHANLAAIAAHKLSRMPIRLVISERVSIAGIDAHDRGFKNRALGLIRRYSYLHADIVTVVADAMVDELASGLNLQRSKVVSIPNPVVTPELLRLAAQAVNHRFAKADVPLLLAVGRLTAQKGFPTLLRAFSQVRRQLPAKLLILGEGEERPALESLVKELGLGDDVDLPGFCPNPYAYMKAASAFILSSAYEGLPGALIQAMAVGTPVVSTDCPTGPAEILENGRWGRLVPIGDPDALAEAILETLRSDRRLDVARRASHYNVDQAVTRYLAVLEG